MNFLSNFSYSNRRLKILVIRNMNIMVPYSLSIVISLDFVVHNVTKRIVVIFDILYIFCTSLNSFTKLVFHFKLFCFTNTLTICAFYAENFDTLSKLDIRCAIQFFTIYKHFHTFLVWYFYSILLFEFFDVIIISLSRYTHEN